MQDNEIKQKTTIYTDRVIRQSAGRNDIDIKDLARNDKDIKKQLNKVFQQANRRIQNITNARLASPAVKAVIAERGKKNYTYFSIKGLNPGDDGDWELIKYEYGRALAFLHNPTSSATGARQYIRYQAHKLHDIPFDSANKIVDLATDPTIDDYGNVNIFAYGDILDDYKTDIMKIGDDMEMSKEQYAAEIERRLEEAAERIAKERSYLNFLDRFF
jgi:hypothetical protein